MRLPGLCHRRSKKRLEDGGDGLLNLAWYLFHFKGWDPMLLAERPVGWRDLVTALASYELEKSS